MTVQSAGREQNMVERMARDVPWDTVPYAKRLTCRNKARAVLAAMQEPTEAMLGAVAARVLSQSAIRPLPWDEGYRVMIDAAAKG